MTDLEQRLAKLQKQFHGLRIIGGEGVNVYGNMRSGYAVEVKASVAQSGTTSGGGGDVPGCTDPTACNFDGSATVDDSSCIYEGACCIDADCSITCSDECGGIYQGDGTECDPNPCSACPEITLLCDSIHASKTKCGVSAYDGSDPVYLEETTTYSGHCTQSCPTHCNGTCSAAVDADSGSTTTVNYDSTTCVNAGTGCSAEIFITSCGGVPVSTGFFGCDINDSYLTGTTATSKDWLRFFIGEGCTACGTVTCTHDPEPSGPPYSGLYDCPDNSCTYTKSTTLSSEYTTSTLISNTEDALPSYFGHFGCDENEEIGFRTEGQNCTCFASRELSTNEHSYEINRFKYKFTFSPSATDFTIDWNEHTEPDAGGPSDNPMSELILAGATESSEYEITEPADNGTISIADITCTPA